MALRAVDPVLGALAVLMIIGVAWRFSQIRQSLIGDEGFTYQDIFGKSFTSLVQVVHTGGEDSPPLYFMLAWFTAKLGDASVWIRLPSILLGTATIPVVYAIGREVFSRTAGLIAAAIVTLSPFAVYYSVEARPYATMAFCVALSMLALLRAVATRSRWWWLLYAVSAAGAAYSHYTSVFLLVTQAAWAFWVCRRRLLEPLLAHGLAALLYLPWLPHVRGKTLFFGGLYPLSFKRAVTDVLRPVVGFPNGPLHGVPTLVGLVAIGLCVAVGLATLLRPAWRDDRALRPAPAPAGEAALRRDPRVVLIVLLALATPVGLLLYSLIKIDIWLPRGLFASAPAQAVALGALLAAPRRVVRIAVVAVVLSVLVVGSIRSLKPAYARPPFRSLAGYLDRVAARQDPVVDISIVGPLVIPTMMRRPHPQFSSTDKAVASAPSARHIYVILDDTLANALKLGTPRVTGFAFAGRKHYGGTFPTDLLTYRRISG